MSDIITKCRELAAEIEAKIMEAISNGSLA